MNKHLYNLTLGLAAAAAMSLASCADDVAAPGQDGEGVWMSIDVSRGSDPASRLTHSEDADGLNVAWEQDDYIYVYGWIEGEGRTYLGKLDYVKTVTDDADGCTASFAGQLTKAPGSENVTIYYAGKDANGNRRTMTAGQDLTVDYASQADSFAAMANNDVMAINGVGVTISNNKVTSASTVVLDHQAAFAHFATDLAVGTQVTISASTITNQISFTSQGGISYGGNTTITASVQEGGDLYVALPISGKPEITFTAGGKTVTLPAPSVALAAGDYYRAGWTAEGGSEGIEVNFNSDAPTSGDWIDLGLESGILWSSKNIGASSPEDYGTYLSWGETSYFTSNTFSDYYAFWITDLGTWSATFDEDWDSARKILGSGYGMPNQDHWVELINNSEQQWVEINGINCLKLTGPNGNSIVLPAAGYRSPNGQLNQENEYCRYWTCDIQVKYYGENTKVGCFYTSVGNEPQDLAWESYYFKMPIRPIKANN